MEQNRGVQTTFAGIFDFVQHIQIPIIQRDYAQGRESSTELRTQFLHALRGALVITSGHSRVPLDLDFVYGSVKGVDTKTLSILDGQQRLTTLFLLHWYLATREGALDDFRARFVTNHASRFSYQTRPSSVEFFDALTTNAINADLDRDGTDVVSSAITDCQWFFDSWIMDPTIDSCLTMLDTIHEIFGGLDGLYERLCESENPSITFHYLDLEHFGLSDDLYIKMNARGKPLTPFENFKAWLFGHISDKPFAPTFELQTDQAWTDVFWRLSNTLNKEFDELFLRFFYLAAYFEACENLSTRFDNANRETRRWIVNLRDSRGVIPSRLLAKNSSFDDKMLNRISTLLDTIHTSKNHFLLEALADVLRDTTPLPQTLFYSYLLFTGTGSSASAWSTDEEEHLRRWTRVIGNLTNNVRMDELASLIPVIKGISGLVTSCRSLYEDMALMDEGDIEFAQGQREEEILKARLILQDPAWETVLVAAEQDYYLMGKVGFILKWAASDHGSYDMKMFKNDAKKVAALLDRNLLFSSSRILQRALLALDDYPVEIKSNIYLLCLPNAASFRDRAENWLRVFDKPVFKRLVDRVNLNAGTAEENLKRIIGEADCIGWRALLVRHPSAISYCKRGLFYKKGEDLKLLTKSSLQGYHIELRSFLLAEQLEKKKKEGQLPDCFAGFQLKANYGFDISGIGVSVGGSEMTLTYMDGEFVTFQGLDEENQPLQVPIPTSLREEVEAIWEEANTP